MLDRWKIQKKIDEYWNEYDINSGILSGVCRQLAFAEGGTFWILKGQSLSFITILGLIALSLYFMTDAYQYYCGMDDYYKLAKESENKRDNNRQIKSSEITKGKVNERAKKYFRLKLKLIFVTSIILGLAFIKAMLCPSNY